MSVDVVCLGETMALVAPDPPAPLSVADHFVLGSAGAESNVAVALARLGTTVQWCSRVADDPFGRRVLAEITGAGVDTSPVRVIEHARTGVFFKDPAGASSAVHYYRDGSAASRMDATDADRALSSTPRILHLTGITPALSPSCAQMVDHAIGRAAEIKTRVSFDVNYRPALWGSRTAAAIELSRLAQRSDIVFVGLDEAATLWGASTAGSVRAVLDQPRVLVVKDGGRSATSFQDGQHTEVPALPVEVVEVIGAGDAFAGGWLHAWLGGGSAVEALRLGHRIAADALSSPTDHPRQPVIP